MFHYHLPWIFFPTNTGSTNPGEDSPRLSKATGSSLGIGNLPRFFHRHSCQEAVGIWENLSLDASVSKNISSFWVEPTSIVYEYYVHTYLYCRYTMPLPQHSLAVLCFAPNDLGCNDANSQTWTVRLAAPTSQPTTRLKKACQAAIT